MIESLYKPFQKWSEKGTIWIFSDPHFDDEDLIHTYDDRPSADELVRRINSKVGKCDTLICLGDVGDISYVRQLRAKYKILVMGNHDTDTRWDFYQKLPNVVEVDNSLYFSSDGYKFYLSHYPTITTRADVGKPLKKCLVNLCGHTHTKDPFEDWGIGMIYHCEVDAHDCAPVRLDKIIADLKQKIN